MGGAVIMPKLSIIVPIYNLEKYLPRCIDSILAQTYIDYEVILINDGSTDRSGNMCDEYAKVDSRVRVLHKKNGGLISSRFAGLAIAVGECVGFIDGDDWVDSCMYEKLMEEMEENKEIDIAIGTYIIEYDDGRSLYPFQKKEKQVCSAYIGMIQMFQGILFNWSLCDKVYKKCLFDNITISHLDVDYSEDTEFNWKLFSRANKVCYKPIQAYHYYYRQDSMVRKRPFQNNIIHLNRLMQIFKEIRPEETELKKSVIELIVFYSKNYIFEMIYDKGSCHKEMVEAYQSILSEYMPLMKRALTEKEKEIYSIAKLPYEKIFSYRDEKNKLLRKNCIDFCSKYEFVFIYGAGAIANEVASILEEEHLSYEGFVVTKVENDKRLYRDKKVQSFLKTKQLYGNKCGFILSLNKKNCIEVTTLLKNEGVSSYINIGQYI